MKQCQFESTICMEGEHAFEETLYIPTCPYNRTNCIHDPAYMKATYPSTESWTFTLCKRCDGYEHYDDEDK